MYLHYICGILEKIFAGLKRPSTVKVVPEEESRRVLDDSSIFEFCGDATS